MILNCSELNENAVLGEEGKLLFDLSNLAVTAENIVSGHPTPDLLLDEGNLVGHHGVDMELLSLGKDLPLDNMSVSDGCIFNGELITPGKHLFYV